MQEHNELREPVLRDYLRLLTAAAIWGSTFLSNDIALVDFSPMAITAYRIIGAALILLVICRWFGWSLSLNRGDWWLVAGIGVLNSVVPFMLIGWGQLTVDSSTTGILLATSPFATLVMSHFLTRDDRFTWNKIIGLALGFSGVFVLLGQGLKVDDGPVSGMLLIMLAACCYALSSVLIRRLRRVSSVALATNTLLVSAIIVLPLLFALNPPWQQTYHSSSLVAIVYLAVGPTALGYMLRTQIVKNNGAVFMSNVGYLIPLFAVFWGWLLLGDIPTPNMFLALSLILTGIAVGQNKLKKV